MNISECEATGSAITPAVFHHIVVATDLTKCSESALAEAATLAEEHQAELSVVHVLKTDWRYEMLENPPEIGLELVDAQERLDAWISELKSTRKINTFLVRRGPVGEAVLRVVAEHGADLLVMGTRGRGGLSKVALGSVAEELLRLAPCAVMTVGPHVSPASDRSASQPILFATDFGKGSAQAETIAIRLAQKRDAKLVLLHMTAPMPVNSTNLSAYAPAASAAEEVQEWEQASRTRCVQQLKASLPGGLSLHQEPEYIVGTDFCAEGILTAAEKFEAGLIVMGANRAGSARMLAHFPWTAVHEVVKNARCAVLTVAG